MSFTVVLPNDPRDPTLPERRMELIDGRSTVAQRSLRRGGVRRFQPATTATLLASFARQPAGFTFFDVGSNIGFYSTLCGLLFEPGAVVAFEPTPATASWARRIGAANALPTHVEQVAVGASPGHAELYLSEDSDASNSLVAGFKPSNSSLDVEVVTIDDYVERSGLAPAVMKIDVEGSEPAVVSGARRTLEVHRPVLVVEVLFRRGHDHGPALDEALDGLGYHRYRLSGTPTWRPRRALHGGRRGRDAEGARGEREPSPHRDWLMTPSALDDTFAAEYEAWASAIRECSPRRSAGDPGAPRSLPG